MRDLLFLKSRVGQIPMLALFCFSGALAGQSEFVDPAAPKVQQLRNLAAPAAEVYDALRTFGAPKPLPKNAVVEDWPGLLGPRRDARSRETGLLADWPEAGPKLVWEMDRGEGFASPAVLGERLVFTHRIGNDVFVDCLEATTGKRFWRFTYQTDYRGEYIRNGGPCATPQLRGNRAWVLGIEGKLHCLELATGRVIWQRALMTEFGLKQQFFGVVPSPLLVANRLFLNIGVKGGPTVVALDANTGRALWGGGDKWGMSCASPVMAKLHGKDRLFVLTGGKGRPPKGGLMVFEPADGTVVTEFPFRSRIYESVNATCPVVVGSTVVLTSSYSTGTIGVAIAEDGTAKRSWKQRKIGLEFSAPIEVGGDLYLVDGIRDRGGSIVCLDPIGGKVKNRTQVDWSEKVTIRGEERTLDFGLGTGSLLHVGGDRFLCLSDNGHLLDLRCTEKGTEVRARVSLFRAGDTWTPLVLSHGLLYVCQNAPEKIGNGEPRLFCYDLRGR